MLLNGYYRVMLVMMVLGGLAGALLLGAVGWVVQQPGWWGVGLLLGLFYGTIGGFALADRS
ncbi:MAG: hypothetical protein U0531_06335 [Dehalococcoidia bacterium]